MIKEAIQRKLALYFQLHYVQTRMPDFIIGGLDDAYLLRWYITPWTAWRRDVPDKDRSWWFRLVARLPAIYLHVFLRDDDDRALHDHPWNNVSWVLLGSYIEHTIRAGGIHVRTLRPRGSVKFRFARTAHRVELINRAPCMSLFFTGWRWRHWGFHCPDRGWVPWRVFTAVNDGDRGAIGRGCN